ncbi:HAD family hydrolase [Cytobacillus sp. IB215665]|uniref:HAD family hydrolase n=1 Tax=Cytobacillus sp. IB215665 TaxID=3097357 RepID=UPI002A103195|nr:HAD family hydrolase [Cytobacillus sp. IB215665]MDX8364235.1 HAD family hydrolase [Cytobacillus sp. IB215665]
MYWDLIGFDLDNTIVHYERTFQRAMIHCYEVYMYTNHLHDKIEADIWFPVFKKYCDMYWPLYENNCMSRKEYRRKRFIHSANELGINVSNNMADEFQEEFDQVVSKYTIPIDGITRILSSLVQKQLRLVVISNGKMDIQYRKIIQMGLHTIFPKEFVIVSEDVGVEKPHKQIFDYAKNAVKMEGKKALYIGDSWELDVLGAKQAGWDAIYFNTRNQQPSTRDCIYGICNHIDELSVLLNL